MNNIFQEFSTRTLINGKRDIYQKPRSFERSDEKIISFVGNEKFETLGIDSLKQDLFTEGILKESACVVSDEQ